ncbi:hypothetical protein [uncultured Aquimarina sp.]|uniref:hypothetical protein n=1 Tax=uncultured Aquimarina sp. TaxID=575652 RepID=UPI00261BEA47|nr:hypothetical protein [uncultured Aquimarina sp.]
MKSNSKLLNYVSHLLSDDDALKTFLVDPITESEGIHGITKAERAVLRRTIAHLSNNSANGYTVSRHLGSYRRSLRLLQNVLHNVGSKMVQDVLTDPQSENATALYPFSVVYNLPSGSNGPVDFTCKGNDFVDQNYGGPYAISTPAYTVQLSNQNPTIKEVMDEVNKQYFSSPVMPYTTVTIDGDLYIKSFTPLSVYELTADLSNSCYDLTTNPSADYVFWFYSINGRANPNTSGSIGTSFADQNLNSGDTVFWQLIAPDATYGFQPCAITSGNKYVKK